LEPSVKILISVLILLALAFGVQGAPTGPTVGSYMGSSDTPGDVTAEESTVSPEPGTLPLIIGAALLLAPVVVKLCKNR
jgi:hypothetical protein